LELPPAYADKSLSLLLTIQYTIPIATATVYEINLADPNLHNAARNSRMPPVQHSPKNDHANFQLILDKIQSSTNEIRGCISAIDSKIDDAMALIQSLENTCQNLDSRLKTIETSSVHTEKRLGNVESANESLKTDLEDVKNRFATVNNSVKTEIHEHLNRYNKRLNIIIYGIPEVGNEDQKLSSLFNIIWSNYELSDRKRIGERKPNTIRPILVPLRTVGDRNQIIDNCKKN